MTKGQVCAIASESGLAPEDLASTVSCGIYSANRGGGTGNCGFCFPCLARRSGLEAALGTDPTTYTESLEHRESIPGDLRDLQQWLAAPFTAHNLIQDMPLPASAHLPALVDMLERGRREFAGLLTTHGCWIPDRYRQRIGTG